MKQKTKKSFAKKMLFPSFLCSVLSQHPYLCAASALLVASYASLRYFVINGVSTNGEEQNLNGKIFIVTGATSGIGRYDVVQCVCAYVFINWYA